MRALCHGPQRPRRLAAAGGGAGTVCGRERPKQLQRAQAFWEEGDENRQRRR
jgi:hypothetical protein